ncbi:MAG: spermidine/putrescine ABC transporter substrate-binding protein [Clostridia bacterium]|nr:spermidine/putrescine ABC transporter substrate-binding protein [Clostridia bacterium]
MKRILISLLACSTLFLYGCSHVADEEQEAIEEQTFTVADKAYYEQLKGQNVSINVYNWGDYIPDGSDERTLDLNKEFTSLTGIKVNYSTYATNEELYAKLKGGGSTYDIIIPSDYMISRMIKENMLEPIDMEMIPNFKYIMESFRDPEYDPGSKFTVPYTWGTVVLIYDNTALDENEVSWETLWDPKLAGNILMFDNPRDAFAVAEELLGYDLNTEDPEELRKAAELLKEQKKYVQAYVMDEIFDKMGAGEAIIAPYYAGDALILKNEYDHISYVMPDTGTNRFVDAVCIPKGSKNKTAAEIYINFLCEPDVALAISEYIGYSTPNIEAYDMLDDEIKENDILYPDEDYLEKKTVIYRNLSDDANLLMQTLWTDMKSSEEQTPNRFIVPAFMALCVIASLTILIRRYIKKKKDIF